jgi:hypothetical protein
MLEQFLANTPFVTARVFALIVMHSVIFVPSVVFLFGP